MKYQVVIEKRAAKFIQKQTPANQKRILQAISKLPFEGDVKPYQTHIGYYRLRVGDFRIIYTVQEALVTVRVTDAGNRGDIYK